MASTRIASTTSCGLLVLSIAAASFAPANSRAATRTSETDACKLLSTAEATTALEQPSKPGKAEAPIPGCFWSKDSPPSDTSRQIWVVIHNLVSFNAAKHTVMQTIKIEPVSGIGDEAFYALYPSAPPFLWAKRGDKSISIRVITVWKHPPFTTEQFKAKLTVLGKAAIARL